MEQRAKQLMCWFEPFVKIRTATSLITFGFSVYKFFQLEGTIHPQQNRFIGPRQIAFVLVSLGLFSLVLATVEYRYNIRALRALYTYGHRSLAVVVAALISLLGVVALLLMVLRQ